MPYRNSNIQSYLGKLRKSLSVNVVKIGREGSKNQEKLVTSFMDGPLSYKAQ